VTLQLAEPLGSASRNQCIVETFGKAPTSTDDVEKSKPPGNTWIITIRPSDGRSRSVRMQYQLLDALTRL